MKPFSEIMDQARSAVRRNQEFDWQEFSDAVDDFYLNHIDRDVTDAEMILRQKIMTRFADAVIERIAEYAPRNMTGLIERFNAA